MCPFLADGLISEVEIPSVAIACNGIGLDSVSYALELSAAGFVL